jgi:hypothetical protein
MARVTGAVTLNMPTDRCYAYLRDSVRDDRFLQAYAELRAPLKYSGDVTAVEHGRRVTISEDGYDTLTNLRLNGWAVTFTLTRLDELRTRVQISVEYGLMLAVLGLTTMRAQAENEILSWIRALLALERGAGHAPVPSLDALREESLSDAEAGREDVPLAAGDEQQDAPPETEPPQEAGPEPAKQGEDEPVEER